MTSTAAARLAGFDVGLAFAGVILTAWLVISHVLREPTCPELIGIPACYIVLAAYLAATAGAWQVGTRAGGILFTIGASGVTLVGAWFSLQQLLGEVACPTFEGLPMCYVSLLAGLTLLGVDGLRRRVGWASRDSAS